MQTSPLPIPAAVPMRGDLSVVVRAAGTKEIVRRYQIRNMVVQGARRTLVELLAQNLNGPRAEELKISALHVGLGNTPPVLGDTRLDNELLVIPLEDENRVPSEVAPYELRILATLEASQGNGQTLQEAGLFTGDRLFARQIHPPIPKNVGFVVDYDWRISFPTS